MVDTREETVCAAQDWGGDSQEHKILEEEEAKSAGQAEGKRRAGRMEIRSKGESLRSDEERAAITKCPWGGESKETSH